MHQLRKRVLDMDGLAGPIRGLAWSGYVCVGLLLVATLAARPIESIGPSLDLAASFGTIRVPRTVVLLTALTQAVGWAFLLAGATSFRRLGFAIVAVVYVLVMASSGITDIPRLLLALSLGALALVVRSARRDESRWHPALVLELACWLAVGATLVAPVFLAAGDVRIITGFEVGLEFIVVLSVPFWFLLSVEMCELSMESGRLFATAGRRWLGERPGLLTAVALTLPPIASLLLLATDRWPMMALDVLFGAVLLAAAVLLRAFGRWTGTTAGRLQVLGIGTLVLVWSVSIGLGGAQAEPQDPLEWLLGWMPLPTIFVFVLAIAYDLLSFGARYCNADSVRMPRRGRVLVYFGFDILVCGALFLFATARDPSGEVPRFAKDLTTAIFGLGVLFLGLPYLAWLLLRRPDAMFGRAPASTRAELTARTGR